MTENRNKPAVRIQAPGRRQIIAGTAAALGGIVLGSHFTVAAADEEISHTAESIHQETLFPASPERVYQALLDTRQFNKVTQLSAAMRSGMAPGAKPTQISREAGGAFTLFGGYVTGRHVELVPNQRIVQAWRAGSWSPGVYSLAKFELGVRGPGTLLVFDHTGFPVGEAQHLAEGWKENYWTPLEKYLAGS